MSRLMQDKQSILHVFSAMMKDTETLINSREYVLQAEDFPEKFHQVIYTAIYNMGVQGAKKVSPIEIDGYLKNYPVAYEIFNSNKGIDYLEAVQELGMSENFAMHYESLKKHSFLRACQREGISTTEIINPDSIDLQENLTQQERFDKMSLEEMVLFVESKMISLRDRFLFDTNTNASGKVGDIAEDILQEALNGNIYGLPMLSKLYTAATLGAKKGKVQLVSAPSGVGKSRWNLANAMLFAAPVLYNKKQGVWYKNPTTGEGVLVTGTELEEDEMILPQICAIAGVDQEVVGTAKITKEEIKRLEIAVKILEITPLYYAKLLDADLADIEHVISTHVNKHNVGYVIHDYVHDGVKLMSYFAKINKNMREDQRLLQVMTRLKELAQMYNIFIMTSTQLNSNYKEEDGLDETSIAGAKSMVNKVDNASIMTELDRKDEGILKSIVDLHGESDGTFNGLLPNITINIFKSRGTKWKLIRLWIHFDKGLLTMDDLFVTDYKGRLIDDLQPLNIVLENTDEVDFSELPENVQAEIEANIGKVHTNQRELQEGEFIFDEVESDSLEFNE